MAAYYGVLMSGDRLIVVAYDVNCRPVGEPLASFPMDVAGMFEALAYARELEAAL